MISYSSWLRMLRSNLQGIDMAGPHIVRCKTNQVRQASTNSTASRERSPVGRVRWLQRNDARVVSEEPLRVDRRPQPGIDHGDLLHLAHARLAVGFIPGEAFARIGRPDLGDAA